jgi:hypothetical protein
LGLTIASSGRASKFRSSSVIGLAIVVSRMRVTHG